MASPLSSVGNWLKSVITPAYPTVPVKSNVDGKIYKVRDMPDKQQAADLLATVRLRLVKLCDYLEQRYPDKPQVKQMIRNFHEDPQRYLEATPDAQHTSYSVNKGESVHLCLREREGANEHLVDENVMTFVALHELSHIITESIGHGPDFWNNFGWLLKEAEGQGIYKYTDFSAHPVSYCGVYITDSPRYDPAKDGTNFQIGKILKKDK